MAALQFLQQPYQCEFQRPVTMALKISLATGVRPVKNFDCHTANP
ncbi:MAG: hypothetical protein [Olavius algarvensis Delta 4 endosymbiont]|nr:MAG: hypothetical protein [Olavius algarvensis Delta 4 endosymbiont]